MRISGVQDSLRDSDGTAVIIYFQGCSLEPKCPGCVAENTELLLQDDTIILAKDIKQDALLKTPFGGTEVKTILEDVTQLYEIELDNGNKVIVGEDHLFTNGIDLLKAKELKIGDSLYGI